MANFVYLLGDSAKREVFIVDPAWQIDTIFKIAEKENLKITGAFVTHGHYDHCNGIDDLLKRVDVPIYVNAEEVAFTNSLNAHGESLFGDFQGKNIRSVRSGDKIKIGDVEIDCLHTPGHTPGSQCFLIRDRLLTGDTLFIRGCGRSDLPGGDPKALYESLNKKIKRLPDETILYPGHNYSEEETSLLKDEKVKNPYLMTESVEPFLSLVGGGRRGTV